MSDYDVTVYDPGYVESPNIQGDNLDQYNDAGNLKRGDRFVIATPELIVVSIDNNYLAFTSAATAKAANRGRQTEATIPARYHFPYIITKVFKAGEIAVDQMGITWGFDGTVWRNRDGEEISTSDLREKGARIMPTEAL